MQTISIKATQPQADFHQLTTVYRAFIAGFGTGKTQTMADSAYIDAIQAPDGLIGLYEPTYDLIRLIIAPRMQQKLDEYGVRWRYNKQENTIYTSSSHIGDFIFRTLDNPDRIVGYETYTSHIDELDTLKKAHAQRCFDQIQARNRQVPKGHTEDTVQNTMSVYTTPEGFKFVYDEFVKRATDQHSMVQASTLSNPFLPKSYVQNLKERYPANLIDAYIEGQFVNLTSGSVYTNFDRELNHCDTEADDFEPLHIGIDFNVGNMSGCVHVERQDEAHCVSELIGLLDTPQMIEAIKARYSNAGRSINIYPDASGASRKTVNAQETDIALLEEAGFTVHADKSNPAVKDRINCVQAMFLNAKGERRYKINTTNCPSTTSDFEQQVYNDKGEPDKKNGHDHRPDAAGYYIAYKYPIIKPLTEIQVKFAL